MWNYQKQKAFVNVIWSKFEGTRNSYGFELIIAEIGVKLLGKIQYLFVILFLLADLTVDNVSENK